MKLDAKNPTATLNCVVCLAPLWKVEVSLLAQRGSAVSFKHSMINLAGKEFDNKLAHCPKCGEMFYTLKGKDRPIYKMSFMGQFFDLGETEDARTPALRPVRRGSK